ncbi:MAG TPA: hypothetical protein VMU51_29035 [Mycobacteriales bacterium]|nr:hypothetical protein [Mycobacteriales bacterium]
MQELALAMCHQRTLRIHRSELPDDVAEYIRVKDYGSAATLKDHSFLRIDPHGNYHFAHRSLVDYFVAQGMFAEIQVAKSGRLAGVQTTHDTDQIVKDLVSEDRATIPTLRHWLYDSPEPLLRVNSAGILAKLGDPVVGDDVVRALRQDSGARHLYLTAIIARVLAIEWTSAAQLADEIDPTGGTGVEQRRSDTLTRLAFYLVQEVHNRSDIVARWSSARALVQLSDNSPQHVGQVLGEALKVEASRETRQAIADALHRKE